LSQAWPWNVENCERGRESWEEERVVTVVEANWNSLERLSIVEQAISEWMKLGAKDVIQSGR